MVKRAWLWTPALAALLAFGLCIPGGFLLVDDAWYVSDNPLILRHRTTDLPVLLNPLGSREALGLEYLPVRDLTYWAESWLQDALGRLLPHPPALSVLCHLDQSLLYGLGTLLLTAFVYVLTRRKDWAFLAGLLFALHPVHAEPV